MPDDFHAYEKELGRRFLVPFLRERGFDLAGKAVLDVGCGQGGSLAALSEAWPLGKNLGIDLDAGMIRAGQAKCPPGVRLEAGDFAALAGTDAGDSAETYDLILMRDCLEHIVDVEGALRRAAGLLAPGGAVFASFAPFASPFGGHQHNGAGPFASVPWLQALPEAWFRRLLRFPGNGYKAGPALEADMATVWRTRLSVGRFRRASREAGLMARFLAGYAVRPDYEIKFGLPAVRFPAWPGLGDLFCTGVEALLFRA